LEREIAPQLDRVIDEPRSEQASPPQFIGSGDHLEVRQCSLQKRRQAAERGHSKLARGDILVILNPLKPSPRQDLMYSFADRDGVGIGEEIPAVPNAGVIAGTCGGNRRGTGGGLSAADYNPSRSESGYERQILGKGKR